MNILLDEVQIETVSNWNVTNWSVAEKIIYVRSENCIDGNNALVGILYILGY